MKTKLRGLMAEGKVSKDCPNSAQTLAKRVVVE